MDSRPSDADAIGIYPVHWEWTKVDSMDRNADFIGAEGVHCRRQLALVRYPSSQPATLSLAAVLSVLAK